ncbi:hypothetical protein B0H19DRAFT_1353062 [Mycena capillaripes]|nr:hypothetical protein B0H19DRAFT_1353062 [Mycena capillaripes]
MASLVFDDTAPQLKYFGAWLLGGSLNHFNSTVHGTREAGARIEFSFTGTSVEVRGPVSEVGAGAPTPISTYVLDGGRPVAFSPNQTATTQFNQLFFQSQVPNGTHSLTITSTVNESLFWIDSIVVDTSKNTIPSSFDAKTLLYSNSPSTSSSSLQPSIIFAIATGSVLLLGCIVAFLIYLCRARRWRKRYPMDQESKPTPFVLIPQRKTRITAFVGESASQLPVVPPVKADIPPVATNRYDYPFKIMDPPKPAARKHRSRERESPPLTEPPTQRRRPSDGVRQPGHPPPRKTLVVKNL